MFVYEKATAKDTKRIKTKPFLPTNSIEDVFASYPSPPSDSRTNVNAKLIPRLIAFPKQCK